MSTSPSWFDQEKFSRLVKKVGPKAVPGGSPPVADAEPEKVATEPEPAPALPVRKAPAVAPAQKMMTSQSISVKSIRDEFAAAKEEAIRAPSPEPDPAPSLISPVPAVKPMFRYDLPPTPEKAAPPVISAPLPIAPLDDLDEPWEPEVPAGTDQFFPEAEEEKIEAPAGFTAEPEPFSTPARDQTAEDLTAAWEKIAQMNEEIRTAIRERDQSKKENALLLEQLKLAEDVSDQSEEVSRLIQERDDALADAGSLRDQLNAAGDASEETNSLREQLRQAEQIVAERNELAARLDEISHVIQERDDIRIEYVELREQYENLKLEVLRPKAESNDNGAVAALEEQVESLRSILAARQQDLDAAQLTTTGLEDTVASLRQDLEAQKAETEGLKSSSASAEEIEPLKKELSELRDQLNQAKEEAAVPQRGLALSQKALQETREALREATESAAKSKISLDNLKKENATFVQQNMLLQAQQDQVSRELSALKAKVSAKN